MDLAALTRRIAVSLLLTPAEKQYWTENLAQMSPEQRARLEGILAQAEQIPWGEQAQTYINTLTQTAAVLAA